MRYLQSESPQKTLALTPEWKTEAESYKKTYFLGMKGETLEVSGCL
jgi:hypothetical protein